MRQYRGLTKDGKWVKGWYVKSFNGQHIILIPEGCCNLWPKCVDGNNFYSAGIEVLPETVCQQTGLKDKKRTKEFPEGQDIYEGDIIEYPNWMTSVTERKVVDYKNAGFEISANIYERRGDINGEIIGNIHEHKNLIDTKT